MTHASAAPDIGAAVVGDHCHLLVPSRLDWIEPTVSYLTGKAVQCGAVGQARSTRVTMALHEALTNSVVHGNLEIASDLKEAGDDSFLRTVAQRCADPRYAQRTVDVRASYDGDCLCWALTDQGPGFDYVSTLRRLDENGPDPERLSGRGLVMMRAFLDDLRYEVGGRRVVLTLHRGGTERRAHPRQGVQQPVRVAPIEEDDTVNWEAGHDALAVNVSADGIALLQSHLSATDRLLVTIPTESGPVSLPALVRHWKPAGSGVLEVGCRFEQQAPPGLATESGDPLGQLLAGLERARSEGGERRRSPRVPFTGCVQADSAAGPSLRGFARDLSRAGLAFITTQALPLGPARLTIPTPDGRALRVQTVVVRSTRIMEGFYDCAACFETGGSGKDGEGE